MSKHSWTGCLYFKKVSSATSMSSFTYISDEIKNKKNGTGAQKFALSVFTLP